jgi:hypothetical protein
VRTLSLERYIAIMQLTITTWRAPSGNDLASLSDRRMIAAIRCVAWSGLE